MLMFELFRTKTRFDKEAKVAKFGKHLMGFQSENAVFKFHLHCVHRALVTVHFLC